MASKLGLGGAKGILPDEMVWEIMTWLPTKSLMRFKTVSKLWLSTILDPRFARAHRSPLRGFLLMNHDPSPNMGCFVPTRDFYFANLDDANDFESNNNNPNVVNFSFHFRIPEDIRRFYTTNMVDGIICFCDRNVAKLYNIATREIINLPESKCAYQHCTYHLGFEPIQSVYKILKICPIYDLDDEDEGEVFTDFLNFFNDGAFNLESIECEILTLGVDSSWRSIKPPPNSILPHGLCVNGVLYWMTVVPGLQTSDYPLYSFHLAGEKFQSIHKPDVFTNSTDHSEIRLFQFGTNLALAQCWWPYNSFGNHKIMITQYREGEVSRTEMKNYAIDQNIRYLNVKGSLPNGNWMMYNDVGGIVENGDVVCLFDQERNYIQKLRLKIPESNIGFGARLCWYEENITSLKHLIEKGE